MQPTSKSYYDTKCAQCERCKFHGFGNYPDGRQYEACRSFGYILHTDKPVVTDIDCTHFIDKEADAVAQAPRAASSIREMQQFMRKRK